jgi:hypothetical protein
MPRRGFQLPRILISEKTFANLSCVLCSCFARVVVPTTFKINCTFFDSRRLGGEVKGRAVKDERVGPLLIRLRGGGGVGVVCCAKAKCGRGCKHLNSGLGVHGPHRKAKCCTEVLSLLSAFLER